MILNDIERAVICGAREYRTNAEFMDAIEAAVIAKLAAGVSSEPVGAYEKVVGHEKFQGFDSEIIEMEDAYSLDQLQTAIAAARVQSIEECALIAGGLYQHYRDLYKGRATPVDKAHWYNPHTDGIADGASMAEDAIRALIGGST